MIYCGDAVRVMKKKLADKSVDAVITDPPYAEVDRDYGRLSEVEWMDLMQATVHECKRVLKPTGSAMFILQPNMEHCGQMRLWLWRFLLWAAEQWNLVQNVYWFNSTTPPVGCCNRKQGLMRPSVKYCVWLGPPNCYRNQNAVLLPIAESTLKGNKVNDDRLRYNPSGVSMRHARCIKTAIERGGSTPFNMLKFSNADSKNSGGAHGHGAATPYGLCEWWVKYISKEGDVILDPFCGSGTVGMAAVANGRDFIGIEKMKEYARIARVRLKEVEKKAAA